MATWERISGLVQAALALQPHERSAFLDTACEGDADLRQQIETLLAHSGETRAVSAPLPLLPRGSLFAHYRVVSELGAGGMGVVYRARDERLDRDVAVKVLPPATFDDPAARARLIREAKAAAALNHVNVCTVYDVGEANGQAYIAMELVEGQTLSATLAAGPLTLAQVLDYGRQLADALAHAHERGIVHRDLKCHNVIVTPAHRVKVLDFGLAKRSADVDVTAAVTEIQATLTEPGTALGTLPYMSPELLRGGTATSAADIWALGVVLYEMATGGRPFTGRTAFEVSAAILGDVPPRLPPALPSSLERLIGRCLEKEPQNRIQSAVEVRAAIEAISPGTAELPVASAPHAGVLSDTRQPSVLSQATRRAIPLPGRRSLALLIAGVLVAGAAVGIWRYWPRTVRTIAVLPFVNVTKDADADYLSDGIAESLITHLNRQPSIAASNLATVLPFKNRVTDARDIGRELGVDTIVTGSVEQVGAGLTIESRLLDVASGQQLWSARYDREAASLLDVQDEMARAIINEGLKQRLSRDAQQRLVQHPTTDGDAYDLYLQARHIQRSASEDDYLYSRELLMRAVVRDPKFALAYAALSGNYAMMVVDGLARPTDAWPQVSRYMKQAAALDPGLPDIHAFYHALAFLFDWDWAEAERQRKQMLEYPLRELDPAMLRAMAVEHWALGRTAEALQLARRMHELDPSSSYLGALEADYLVNADQPEAAVPLYERAIKMDPGNPNAYFGLAEAKARQHKFDEAIDARRKAHEVAGDVMLKDVLASARGEAGYRAIDRAWVLVQLEALKERQATSYTSPLDFARVYAQLGDREQAFKYLDASFIDRSPGLVFLKVDRAWDLVRDDPRFDAAIRKVGLP